MVQAYKPLYSVEETAEIFGANKNFVYDLLKTGELPFLILKGKSSRGSKRIRGSDLEKFIESYKPEEPDGVNKKK